MVSCELWGAQLLGRRMGRQGLLLHALCLHHPGEFGSWLLGHQLDWGLQGGSSQEEVMDHFGSVPKRGFATMCHVGARIARPQHLACYVEDLCFRLKRLAVNPAVCWKLELLAVLTIHLEVLFESQKKCGVTGEERDQIDLEWGVSSFATVILLHSWAVAIHLGLGQRLDSKSMLIGSEFSPPKMTSSGGRRGCFLPLPLQLPNCIRTIFPAMEDGTNSRSCGEPQMQTNNNINVCSVLARLWGSMIFESHQWKDTFLWLRILFFWILLVCFCYYSRMLQILILQGAWIGGLDLKACPHGRTASSCTVIQHDLQQIIDLNTERWSCLSLRSGSSRICSNQFIDLRSQKHIPNSRLMEFFISSIMFNPIAAEFDKDCSELLQSNIGSSSDELMEIFRSAMKLESQREEVAYCVVWRGHIASYGWLSCGARFQFGFLERQRQNTS